MRSCFACVAFLLAAAVLVGCGDNKTDSTGKPVETKGQKLSSGGPPPIPPPPR